MKGMKFKAVSKGLQMSHLCDGTLSLL